MRAILRPDFDGMRLDLFDTVAAAPKPVISTFYPMGTKRPGQSEHPKGQPNSLAAYRDSSVDLLFISCVLTDGTYRVLMFDRSVALAGGSAVAIREHVFPSSIVGLAIQPGTGDLYIATWGEGDPNGGVWYAPRHPAAADDQPYSELRSFATYQDDSIAGELANLAFDPHGGLWLTQSSRGDAAPGDASRQFLICFTDVPANKASYYKLVNGDPFTNVIAVAGSPAPPPLLPLSQPEGLAFDPLGNLWLANNNDDLGVNGDNNGSLVCFSTDWLRTLRGNPADGSYRGIDADAPGVSIYYRQGAKFGGLAFDGFTLYANDQGFLELSTVTVVQIAQYGEATNLDVSSYGSSGISATYPGNGQMLLIDTAPAQLTIRDWSGDTGTDPSGAPYLWESPDIFMLVFNAGNGEAIVSVHNTGTVASSGQEVVKVYWALASAGLSWPTPWDGYAAPSLFTGGLLGAQLLPIIQPGAVGGLQFFGVAGVNLPLLQPGLHFCLIARIEATPLYPFGMDNPETTTASPAVDLNANVANNRAIGWHNVVVQDGPGMMTVRPANYQARDIVAHLKVEYLDEEGREQPLPGRLTIDVAAHLVQRVRAFQASGLVHVGGERFELRHGDEIRGITLAPNEALALHVRLDTNDHNHGYAVRFIQIEDRKGRSHVIGGQTFVVGDVKGFPRTRLANKATT